MKNPRLPRVALWAAFGTACLAVSAFAQTTPVKTAVVEPVPAAPAFEQWAASMVALLPTSTVQMNTVQMLPWVVSVPATAAPFQARPVILGQPDLPLVGDAAAQAMRSWNAGLNYQGLHMKLVSLDANGNRQARSLAGGLQPGQRFKIRMAATFEAVAVVDKLAGEPWNSQRVGQVYPQAGMSVHMYAGETVELPLGDQYFVAGNNPAERLVVSVRHPRAQRDLATDQPAYRQDGATGSSYLQLVPAGKLSHIEQVIVTTAR
jgi:hypothetical protein